MKSSARALSIAALLLLVTGALFAQGTYGTLTGSVIHDGGPLPGVTVTVTSPSMQGARTVVTGEQGSYMIPALPPGDYSVTFEMSGMQQVTKKVRLSIAQISRADATLVLSAVSEAITVTAAAPAVLETTEVATNMTAKQVDDLPIARTIQGTALMAPGVTTGISANQVEISGAPGYDNLILVNGVVVNENLRSQIHNLFIEDAIEETTVMTGSVSAEYGRFTGGVVSTITKSGGNEFSGSFRDNLDNSHWTKKTPWATQADPIDKTNHTYEATLGGYVLRDHLWFFAGWRSREVAAQRYTAFTNLPYVLGDEEQRIEGKLTGAITPKHNVVVSYIDVTRDLVNNSFGNIMDTRSFYNQGQPNKLGTVSYNGVITQNFFIEGSYSQKDFTFVGGGAPSRDRIEGTLLVDSPNNRRFWSPTFCGVCSDEERNNESWLVKGTYYLNTASFGSHSFVVGGENFAETRLVNNHQSGSDYRILLQKVIHEGNNIFPVIDSGSIIQWNPILFVSPGSDLQTNSIFINDRWDFNRHFSFNVGARYDQNDATDSFGNVVSDDSAFSPRLAADWDLRADGRHRVKASYARYVSKIMDGNVGGAASPAGNPATITFFYRGPTINTGTGSYLGSAAALAQMWAAFDAAGSAENYNAHPWLRTVSIPGQSTIFPGSIVSPSVDEFTVGYGTTPTTNSYIRADFIMREWRDFYAEKLTLETGKTSDGRGDVGHITNTDDIERKYRALQLQSSWRPGRFNTGLNYTWATLRGNDGSEGAATATSPNTPLSLWYPQYLGYAQRMPVGSLAGDVRHRARAWVGYDFPMPSAFGRFNISVLHRYESGTAYGAAGTIDASGRTNPFTGAPTNPGYVLSRLGDQHTYWFTDRDAFRTPDFNATDVALNYSIPLWQIQLFATFDMTNALDNDEVMAPNTTIVTRRTGGATSGLVAFNPMTDTPQEGVHWRKGPNFGNPTGVASYQNPREYRLSLGVRF